MKDLMYIVSFWNFFLLAFGLYYRETLPYLWLTLPVFTLATNLVRKVVKK